MRVFFLRLTQSDFVKVGRRWESPVIDLYDNQWYRNYSTVKSDYGVHMPDSRVWIGRTYNQQTGATTSGRVSNGRFIDTSGQISLVSWLLDPSDIATLDVYQSDDASRHYPEEWSHVDGLTAVDGIGIDDAERYAKFVLHVDDLVSPDTSFLVRIEIGPPNIDVKFAATQDALYNFPKWMAIREVGVPATPATATPTSRGGAVINAIAGEWLDELRNDLSYLDFQRFIDTVDLSQKAWVYKTSSMDEYVWSVVGDGVQLGHAVDLSELYEATDDEDVFYLEEATETVYCNKQYASLTINGTVFSQEPHHVWNYVDELGLLVDLNRLSLEANANFRLRILDVYRNRGGVGVEEFKLALRRELDLWRVYGSTPDSNFVGATPDVLEISDLESDPQYVDPDGMPTRKFTVLVDLLAKQYPTTWGRFFWDQAMWDIGGSDYSGYQVLPYRMDATPLPDASTQSGIGDGNDLLVYSPDVITGPHTFHTRMRVRGRQRNSQTDYLPVKLSFSVVASADRKFYSNPAKTVWLSLEVTQSDLAATPTLTKYVASFQMTATSDIDVNRTQSSANSYAFLSPFANDLSTSPNLIFQTLSGNYVGRLSLNGVTSVVLKHGQWNVGSQTYVNKETSDTFNAWFSTDTNTQLSYNAGTPTLTGSASNPLTLPMANVVLVSKVSSYTMGRWSSQPQTYDITINGAVPDTTQSSVDVQMPGIAWDNYIENVPNKQYRITLLTPGTTPGVFGAYVTGKDNTPFFIDSSYIRLNGNSTWTGGTTKTMSANTAPVVTFSTASGSLYPVTGYTWTYFEAQQNVTMSGTIDENGPWRHNEPVSVGNTNYQFDILQLSRSDFGIPNSADYVPTWIGIDVTDGDSQVIAWVGDNTIAENVDYSFVPVHVYARLRPDAAPQWYPQINSGWFYERQKEYYLYANPAHELVTSATPVLSGQAHQGAPIIVKTNEATPREFREVAFFADATPVTLTLQNQQLITSNGTTSVFLDYPDVYGVTVVDLSTGATPIVSATSSTNEVHAATPVTKGHQLQATYKLRNSYFVDNNYEYTDGTLRTKLVFDKSPTQLGVSGYWVTYESSVFNPATPVDVPLNPLYTVMSEGFIFISHDEYTLDQVSVYVSPSKIIADGQDYLVVSIHSEDKYGNPKPGQAFHLTTSFGTLDKSNVTTDRDGHAVVVLTAASTTTSLVGTITITGGVSTSVTFDIDAPEVQRPRILCVPSHDRLPADGLSQNYVYGRIEGTNFAAIAGAQITWKRSRSVYGLFTNSLKDQGTVTADSRGVFTIGPFTTADSSSPGFWFLSVESSSATGGVTFPVTGDVIYWLEYPDSNYGVENMTGLTKLPVQLALPAGQNPSYTNQPMFPANYDEATPSAPKLSVTTNWLPPIWYALDRYHQYQMGLLGSTPNTVSYGSLSQIHPSGSEM